jgi:hypothetical protein
MFSELPCSYQKSTSCKPVNTVTSSVLAKSVDIKFHLAKLYHEYLVRSRATTCCCHIAEQTAPFVSQRRQNILPEREQKDVEREKETRALHRASVCC